HGQVDASADDHEGQAHREDDQVRVVDEQVRDGAELEDAPVGELAVEEHQHEDHQCGDRGQGIGAREQLQAHALEAGAGRRFGWGRDRGAHAATASFGASDGVEAVLDRRARNSARTRSDCSRHRAMITMALNAGVAEEEIPRNTTVLSSVAMSRAPTAAPVLLNFPPASEVPPMTTARIASISSW